MAKIIRCPNCGENVEIPPNPTGQIVTCIACGTAMRLKSKKDAGDMPPGDSSAGSMGGSMSATRVTSDAVQTSPDDPPSLGGECEVCGRPTDPTELVEDRGHLTCRDCIKGARSSRPRAKAVSDDELIPFSEPSRGAGRRGNLITFGMPFFVGCAALAVYVGSDLFIAFNPKPVGTGVIAKTPDEPPRSTQTAWDEQNLSVLVKMMEEANALKADPNRLSEARQKYDAVVAHATGQSSGSQEVRRLVDLAEQESEALRVAAAPMVEEPVAVAPTTPPVEVPDTVAAAPNSVFDDIEVEIDDKLNGGMTDLEAAVTAVAEAAEAPAKAALVKFSEARELLIREKRNVPDDPGWAFANHGTAVAYIYAKNYPNALTYLDRLPSPPDRAAVLNRVVTLLQMRENKGEAIQLLVDHLNSDAGADDSYALNLLGTTLARYADDVIKHNETLRGAKAKYDEIVKKIGEKHPGERRWGARWIGINEWEARDKERRIQNNRIEDLERALTKTRVRIGNFQEQVDRGNASPRVQASLMADKGEEQVLLTRIQTERAKIPPEEWLTPEQIVPVLPDLTAVNARTRGGTGAATQPDATGG